MIYIYVLKVNPRLSAGDPILVITKYFNTMSVNPYDLHILKASLRLSAGDPICPQVQV